MMTEKCGAVKHNMSFDEAQKMVKMVQYWKANLTSAERRKHDAAIDEVYSLMCESMDWHKEPHTGE